MAKKRPTKKAARRRTRHEPEHQQLNPVPHVPALLRAEPPSAGTLDGIHASGRSPVQAAARAEHQRAMPSLAGQVEVHGENMGVLLSRLDSFLCRMGRARPPREGKPDPANLPGAEIPHLQRVAMGVDRIGCHVSQLSDMLNMLEEIG